MQAEPLLTNFGAGTLIHPLQEPDTLRWPGWCGTQPFSCCKEKVHIFGVNGLNPLCLANFNGMCGYFKKQGFENTHFGQMCDSPSFAQKVRAVRQNDPDAKIVLVGFSLGANLVQAMANDLAKDGISVDLVVYLAGDFITNCPASFPSNVGRVVNIRAQGLILCGGDLFFNSEDIDGALNCRLDCGHFLAPSRRESLGMMMEELLRLACVPEEPAPQSAEPAVRQSQE